MNESMLRYGFKPFEIFKNEKFKYCSVCRQSFCWLNAGKIRMSFVMDFMTFAIGEQLVRQFGITVPNI
jgi:hypothetical protein